MKTYLARIGVAVLAAALLIAAGPATAQQVNPTELSVQEQAVMEALQGGEAVSGRVSIPDAAAADLIKPAGRDWSDLHRGTMFAITVWTLVGMLGVLALFFLLRGRMRLESGLSGRTITRFNVVERFAHWLTAVPFVILALTGLNLVVGQYVILPLFGEAAFGTLSAWGKIAHNYLAWPFMLGLVLIFLLWVKDNIPNRTDREWLAKGGGFLGRGAHPPARRFNAGQKLVFWSVVIGGGLLSLTGVFLIFPEIAGTAANWQLAQVVHGLAAAILTAIILGHIYIGSIGMEGAYDAMGSGEVDLNWAREHHALWVEEKLGAAEAGKPRAVGGGRPVAPAE